MVQERPEIPRSDANYHAHDHAAMKREVTDKVEPGRAGEIARAWQNFGQRLVDAAIAFKTMEAGTSAMWSGKAAEGAQTQFAGFTKATETLGQQHNAVGSAIQTQASAAETAKNAMPDPVPYEPGKMLKEAASSGNPFKLAATLFTIPAQKAKSEEAKAQAVQVMQTRDSTFTSSAATMPTFTELPQTKEGPSEPPPRPLPHPVDPGGNDGRNVRPPGGIGTPPGTGGTPGFGITPPVGPGQTRPSQNTTRPSWQTGNNNQQNQNPNQRTNNPNQPPRPPIGGPFPPGTRPPGQMPGGGRGGGPGGAAAARAGGPGGFGGGKPGGSFGPSNPGGQAQGPGGRAGVMGTGAGPQQGGFGPSNAGSAARGAAGMGAGGMGAGAGQGQGDEDKEHKAAAYLVEAEDVFGDGETLVAPPVIGE